VAEPTTRRRPTVITPEMADHAALLAANGSRASDIATVLDCSPRAALDAIRRGGGKPARPGRRPTPIPDAVAALVVEVYGQERSLVRTAATVNAAIGDAGTRLTPAIVRRILQHRGIQLGPPRRCRAGGVR